MSAYLAQQGLVQLAAQTFLSFLAQQGLVHPLAHAFFISPFVTQQGLVQPLPHLVFVAQPVPSVSVKANALSLRKFIIIFTFYLLSRWVICIQNTSQIHVITMNNHIMSRIISLFAIFALFF